MTAGEVRTAAGAPQEAVPVQRAAAPALAPVPGAYSIEDLRELARKRLPRAVFEFIDGGAEEELTLRENRAAFQRVRLAPRVLVDVSQIDTSMTLMGGPSRLPIAISPTGAIGFGWPGGDLAIARAAAAAGIPFSLSTTATTSIETIARETPGRHWFQLYVLKKRDFMLKLVERARAADYEVLIVTVDLPVGGKRERDLRNDFSIPFRFTPRNFLDFASRPGWALSMLRHGMPTLENLVGFTPESTSAAAIASSVGRNYDRSFDWDRLKALRDVWPRKLVVKGVARPDDAERIAAMGCDGLIVSNHGGRQLDGAIATLDALPAIARAVGGRISVLLDGGIRRGVDVVKALALGAQGVLIGRATLYGVCAAGEAGANWALEILRDELVRAMQLCGARTVREIGPDLIAPPK
jgi:(S)-mandelate dehydrogenase